MKALKALVALLMLAVLLGGVPALLLAWGDPFSLVEVPWSTALIRPDDGAILLGLLSVVGWVAWLIIAVTTITELISLLSRRRIRIHLPGITWLQPAVGALLILALSPVLSSQADGPAPPPASHAPQEVEQLTVGVAPPLADQTKPSRDYAVVAGDELWGVAERELGNGADWRIIVASNPGMTASTVLTPGEIIQLPAPAGPSSQAQPAEAALVIVERDDTLWDLAEEHLGDAYRWPEIFDANRSVVADPDQIDIGWQLSLPADARITESAQEALVPRIAESAPMDTGRGGSDASQDIEQGGNLATPSSSGALDVAVTPSKSSVTETAAASSSASGMPTTVATSAVEPALVSPGARTDNVSPADGDAISSSSTEAPAATSSPVPDSIAPVPGGGELRGSSSVTGLDALGPVGGALAASLVAGVMARRQVQLLHRSIGSRVAPIAPSLQRFFAALIQRSESAPGGPPALQATSVVLGWNRDGDVNVDLERERCTLLTGTDEHTAGMAAAILTSLLCADWSAGVEVVAVQPDEEWSNALDDPRLITEDHLEGALTHLQKLCAQRRLQLGHDTLTDVRADPDRADMWSPVVFVFCQSLPPGRLDRIRDCLALGPVGISVVAASQSPALPDSHASVLHIESETHATLNSGSGFQPQLLSQPARHAVMSLFTSALDERTTPAPWWRNGDEAVETAPPDTAAGPFKDGAMSAWPIQPENPTLLLLGPVELQGCSGERPTRAVGQCVEYCAWLLLHPESSPSTMVRELLVAETTRRSNMSRLRKWLGSDTENNPYLPDAYSGRISLAPPVTSDWERFQSLLAGGVNTSSTPLLHQALSLVRGRPLDGVSFQWPWTSQWLTDMTSMISDAATVLADRYLTDQDYPAALWAINQGQLATGDDEILAVRRIQVLAHMGENTEVDAAVMQLTRSARAANRDLSADSIRRVQHALHLSVQQVSSS